MLLENAKEEPIITGLIEAASVFILMAKNIDFTEKFIKVIWGIS